MHLNLIKGIYDKLTDDTLNHEKMESFSFKLSNKPRMPTSATFIQRYTGSLSHSDEARERNKRHTDRKGGSKIFQSQNKNDCLGFLYGKGREENLKCCHESKKNSLIAILGKYSSDLCAI